MTRPQFSKADKLRELAARYELAAGQAEICLSRQFTEKEKCAVFDRIHALAREFLHEILNEGHVSHHVKEAFEGRVLTTMWGESFYNWVYDLEC